MPLLPQWGKEHSVIMAGGSPCSVRWGWGGSGYYHQRGRTADPGRWGGLDWRESHCGCEEIQTNLETVLLLTGDAIEV